MATGTLDPRFSEPQARPSSWQEVDAVLAAAGTYWLTTVRRDGRPHVTPLIAVWHDECLYFTTGEGEQKARNLTARHQVALTTGSNALKEGLDVVVEGEAVRVREQRRLELLAAAWVGKYGEEWRFEVRDGAFRHQGGGAASVFEVAPTKVLAFRKGGTYAQTSWRPCPGGGLR
ncbi:pyridoxamine 5'-phosphate oxidase family protein [Streptomyces sp. NBC_01190]|uniref:pyridoxamine 5'-phosphate oxidase family protein n=1 Tax=Streptomyces sp. NBC_01190 TaxID=2903767 RepID=UPI00386FD2FC|nr:pyridoxamine 5'-phosphate oxidase family protein [Streptomyces sp. NBC_01190]